MTLKDKKNHYNVKFVRNKTNVDITQKNIGIRDNSREKKRIRG